MRALLAGMLLVPGGVLVAVGRLAAAGRLPRNGLAGIRTRATMASEPAWLAAHRAGGGWLQAAGLVGVAGGLAAAALPPEPAGELVAGVAAAGLLALVAVAGVRGQQAARRAAQDGWEAR